MAIALIRSTENGDLYSVEYAAGTSTVDLTPAVAGRNVQIRSGTLLVSAAATVQLLEETTATAIKWGSRASPAFLGIDKPDQFLGTPPFYGFVEGT